MFFWISGSLGPLDCFSELLGPRTLSYVRPLSKKPLKEVMFSTLPSVLLHLVHKFLCIDTHRFVLVWLYIYIYIYTCAYYNFCIYCWEVLLSTVGVSFTPWGVRTIPRPCSACLLLMLTRAHDVICDCVKIQKWNTVSLWLLEIGVAVFAIDVVSKGTSGRRGVKSGSRLGGCGLHSGAGCREMHRLWSQCEAFSKDNGSTTIPKKKNVAFGIEVFWSEVESSHQIV